MDQKYHLMDQTLTYARGVQALRDSYARGECPSHPTLTTPDGSRIVRPLTFKENIEARVEDFETLHDSTGRARTMDQRLSLFDSWIDSCTGIAYKKGTTKFKIIPQCYPLIDIDMEFKNNFMSINYLDIVDRELDSSTGVYNQSISKEAILNHPGWLAAVEDDKILLRSCMNVVFTEYVKKYGARDNLMGFYVRQNTEKDELRALFVSNLYNNFNADGDNYFNCRGSFLRVAHASTQKKE